MTQAELDYLVLTAKEGSEKALGLLFNAYHKPLIGFAIKICADRELACDAVQEAWIKASRTIKRLDDPRAFASWIYRLVRWKVIDIARKRSKDELLTESFDDRNIEVAARESEPDENLSLAIEQLPALEKQIIHLFYLDELKLKEVSIILEIPVGTVKSRLNRARNQLKQHYQTLES